jgi:hypothetical protein
MVALLAAGAASAVLSGCGGSSAPAPGAASPAAPATADCPKVAGGDNGAAAIVDYVDFVQAFGRQYVAGLRGTGPATKADLGRVVLRSRCSFSAFNDRTHANPGEPRDGDTAFLPPGTPIHALRGWPARCRLAAEHDGRVVVYLAYREHTKHARPVPCAVRGGDAMR